MDLVDNTPKGYSICGKTCASCNIFVIASSTLKCFATNKVYKIKRHLTCETRNVIYVAFCVKCQKQGVGSTVEWKPRMRNYKSHINKDRKTCRIAKHFIDVHKGWENLRFFLVDCLNNVNGLNSDQIDDLLLEKEKFWIGTLVTQHKGLNSTHDWVRSKRNDREKNIV